MKLTDINTVPYIDSSIKGICIKGYENLRISEIPFDNIKNEFTENYHIMKSSRSRCTLRFDYKHDGRFKRLYVKRYLTWRFSRKIGYLFVPSKAKREWHLGYSLLKLGFKTPLPLLVAEKKIGPFIKENYLVTLGIEPYKSILFNLKSVNESDDRISFMKNVADYIRKIHDNGFYHDDLSAEHIFYNPEEENKSEFALIDLDNGRLFKEVSKRRKIKNLFQIFRSIKPEDYPLKERYSFLEQYFKCPPAPDLIRQINKLALKKTGKKVL
jgi:tRNA A-37 threonylcarbamoyl transferase component Bud32